MKQICFFLLTIGCCLPHLHAQKVALVLSGGGAKGLAHVGVIRALEENGIPIDYIAGTSMGGLVGGFYAAGYSPDEMEVLIRADAFQDWVYGKIDESHQYLFPEFVQDPSWLSIDLQVKEGLQTTLASNLASDIRLNFVLASHMSQASRKAQNNFDSLFVPFRTTGSEVFSQELEVIGAGYLNEAMRTTMAVPVFYRPIKFNGRYLFDGGIYNNFPVDIAQTIWEPDIIIGVIVSDKDFIEYPEDKIEDLLPEAAYFALMQKADTTLIENAIYIKPNLEGYSAIDFGSAGPLSDSGYVAALRKLPTILNQIKRRANSDSLNSSRNTFKQDSTGLLFTGLKLNGFNTHQAHYVESFLRIPAAGIPLNELRSRYYKLVSEDYFKRLIPAFRENPFTHTYDLELSAKPQNIFTIDAGGLMATQTSSFLYLGINHKRLDGVLSGYHLGIQAGSFYKSIRLRSRVYFPSRPHMYIEPHATFNNWNFLESEDLLNQNVTPTFLEQSDGKIGVDLGLATHTRGRLVFHASYLNNRDRYSNTDVVESSDLLDEIHFEAFRTGLRFTAGVLEAKQYPQAGKRLELSVDYFAGSEDHDPGTTAVILGSGQYSRNWLQARFQFWQLYQLNAISIGYSLESSLSTQQPFRNYIGTLLYAPAAHPLPESKTLFLPRFRAFNYGMVGIDFAYNLSPKLSFRSSAYAFAPFWQIEEISPQIAGTSNEVFRISAAATGGFVYNSPVGPISIRASYYDDERHQFFLLAHIGYMLYNKRSIE